MKDRDWPDASPHDDSLEVQNVKVEDIINHPFDDAIDLAAYAEPCPEAPQVDDLNIPADDLKSILGWWNGYPYESETSEFSLAGMLSMNIVLATVEGSSASVLHFQSSGRTNDYMYEMTGSCKKSDSGIIEVNFIRKFNDGAPSRYAEGTVRISSDVFIDLTCLFSSWTRSKAS